MLMPVPVVVEIVPWLLMPPVKVEPLMIIAASVAPVTLILLVLSIDMPPPIEPLSIS
jgi:hypothetical protein